MIVREVEAVQVESVKGEHCHHCAEGTPPLHLISAPMFAHTAIKEFFFCLFFNTGTLGIYIKRSYLLIVCCYLVHIIQLCPENMKGELGPTHPFRFPSNFYYEGILYSSHLRNIFDTHLNSSS